MKFAVLCARNVFSSSFTFGPSIETPKKSVFVAQNLPVVELVDHTNQSPGPGCVNSTQCYDGDADPKGETYDGCVNTTVSGRECQVGRWFFIFCISLSPGLGQHHSPLTQVHKPLEGIQQLPKPKWLQQRTLVKLCEKLRNANHPMQSEPLND